MQNWSAAVHTALSTDTEPTIIVNFDDAKYIFNASENATRAFRESNGNWKKTKAMFFTQSNVEKTSGLAGKQQLQPISSK
jgi:ribonuclease Z